MASEVNNTSISSENIFDRSFGIVVDRVILCIVSHPFCFARTLIQLGHEPLPPVDARSFITGEPIKLLPNVFTYIKYIYHVDGFFGCFRGLSSRIWFTIFSTIGYCTVVIQNVDTIEGNLQTNEFGSILKWDLLATAASTILSHPFFIIYTRQMAQFIGKETVYSYGILNSLLVIAKEESIFGWFNGLTPRLFDELFTVFLIYLFVHLFNYILETPPTYHTLVRIITVYFVTGYMYPFKLIGVRMAVNNSGLKAGYPPLMPNYNGSWSMCYDHLLDTNNLYRGAALFRRPYTSTSSISFKNNTPTKPNEHVKLYTLNLGTIKQVFRTLM